MKIRVSIPSDCIRMSTDSCGTRKIMEREVVWPKVAAIKEDVFCVSIEDLGLTDGVFESVYTIHTESEPCSCDDTDICDRHIESIFGARNGIMSEHPGGLTWGYTNIPFINKLRTEPIRISFPLHGSFVDVPAGVLTDSRDLNGC